jgi:hypothetical protein
MLNVLSREKSYMSVLSNPTLRSEITFREKDHEKRNIIKDNSQL